MPSTNASPKPLRTPQKKKRRNSSSRGNLSKSGAKKPWPQQQPRTPDSWRTWSEVSLKLDNLPLDVTTLDLWNWFSGHGDVAFMRLFAPRANNGTMSARISFEPPPERPFWSAHRMLVQHPDTEKYPNGLNISVGIIKDEPHFYQSKNLPDRSYPLRILAKLSSLDFGAMVGPTSMNVRHSVMPSVSGQDFTLEIEVRYARLTVKFYTVTKLADIERVKQFKFVVDMSAMKTAYQTSKGDGGMCLIIPLQTPPEYFRKNENVHQSITTTRQTWSIRDAWNRTTDIAEEYDVTLRYPIGAMNEVPGNPDIGRWTTFRLALSDLDTKLQTVEHIRMAMEDKNIKIQVSDDFQITNSSKTMWDYLEHPPVAGARQALALLRMPESPIVYLTFKVRYLLEVCVTRGIFNEHIVSLEFLERLASLDPSDATCRLEYVIDKDQTLYDPMVLFRSQEAAYYIPNANIPYYCTVIQKAVITPTTIRFNAPTVETSNRVTRQYNHIQDRFLRLQFLEEDEDRRITFSTSSHCSGNDHIFKRILRTLYQGIKIGDRRYEFLAFGSSQLRQCGVYFFCPTDHISCDDIRRWMGQFQHIRVVAKYAARLGQCFSTTREMRGIPAPKCQYIPDIERNGYCFSDGVGIISDFLARLIVEEMTMDVFCEPSAFQFRMGGCKGVLVVWPGAKAHEVHIRESQEKFKADAKTLEIIKCAKFSTATLNRQTITILESLGVPIKAFEDLLERQKRMFDDAMKSTAAAVEILTKCVDENQSTLILAEFLQAGFKTDSLQEPFVMNILKLWRSWSLKILKEKARIEVEKSAFVLGCVDESGTLRGHAISTEGSKEKDVNKLPQIFLQLSDPKRLAQTTIVKGICIVGRNPSLHPGDIRVVQAVDIPKLHHLRDIVVFPSEGDRPVPSMLSGGDLDGDDFFVIWDSNLIPSEWNHPAMDYHGPKPKQLDRDVNENDLRNFFVEYLKSDVLGLIATAHVGFADMYGPKSAKCLHLAELHSKAVDYPKTGQPAAWGQDYHLEQWPHFMEKKRSYKSKKALGVIYDRVVKHSIEFLPDWEKKFDQRIITRFSLDYAILKEARKIKSQYDVAVRRILAQYKVETEFELYTGWAMTRPAFASDYKRQEDLGQEYDALKQRFRDICCEAAGGQDGAQLDKFVAAMYKVTEEEIKIALYEHHRGPTNEGGKIVPGRKMEASSMPLMTFPWIFPWVMVRIASKGKYKPKNSVLAAAHKRIPTSKVVLEGLEDDTASVMSTSTVMERPVVGQANGGADAATLPAATTESQVRSGGIEDDQDETQYGGADDGEYKASNDGAMHRLSELMAFEDEE